VIRGYPVVLSIANGRDWLRSKRSQAGEEVMSRRRTGSLR